MVLNEILEPDFATRSAVAAIRLLLLTGCLKSEILTLRLDDVESSADELRLCDSKRGPRMVPLTTPVLKVLDEIERIVGNPRVTRSLQPGAFPPDLTYYWKRILSRAGLEGVRIHVLHHSCAAPACPLMARKAITYGNKRNKTYGLSLCFRSHQMLIGLLRSRHGFRTVPGDVRELLDLRKLVSSAVRQAGGLVFGPD